MAFQSLSASAARAVRVSLNGRKARQASSRNVPLVAGGVALSALGASRRSIPGAILAAAGGYLVYRGVAGGKHAWRGPMEVRKAVTINQSPEELYRFWRDFENLPRFMTHLESVKAQGPLKSRWVARGPAHTRFAWEAEIVEEIPNQVIRWQSLAGSEIDSHGSVEFLRAPGNRGTEVRVEMVYEAPAGKAGAALAAMFGEEPEQQVREDLRHFKQLMEAGEVATTEGQPSGHRGALTSLARRVHGLSRPNRPAPRQPQSRAAV
jgi:uncharacterized membrane protein